MTISDNAVSLFKTECNCAQAVLLAFAESLSIEKSFAKQISAPFGGGMGRTGTVCGAISGALMVLGLKYGNKLSKEDIYLQTSNFIKSFKNEHKYTDCNRLTGFDMSNPVQREEALKQKVSDRLCAEFIKNSVLILEKLLSDIEVNNIN